MKTQEFRLFVVALAFEFLAAPVFAATSPDAAGTARIPAEWYALPENGGTPADDLKSLGEPESAGAALDTLYTANTLALDALKPTAAASTKWHLVAFSTELSVSASGLLGPLVLKGTPSVIAYWRKQNPAPEPSPEAAKASDESAYPVPPDSVSVGTEMAPADLDRALEPAIATIARLGKVKDESALRANLREAARGFQELARAAEDVPESSWWVSQLRLDLGVDASGTVFTGITAGGDVRVRMHWARLMKKGEPRSATNKSERAGNFAALLADLASDVATLSAEPEEKHRRIRAHGFRVGIGFLGKVGVGVVKAGTSAAVHAIFTRGLPKPVVNPPSDGKSLTLIDEQASPDHLKFASENGVPVTLVATKDATGAESVQAVYEIDRAKFRKGLRRALKMGEFFAKRAEKQKGKRWKIHEIKTGFELSMTGTLGIATLGGVASAEIAFYNYGF